MISLVTMKRSLCIGLSMIAVSTFCCAATPASKLFKFDDLRFSIECPPGYTAEKYENTVSVLLSHEGDDKSFRPNITLSSAPNSKPPIDLDKFFNLVLQNFLKDANFSIQIAEKAKFNEKDIYQLLYKRTAAAKDAHDNAISTMVYQVYIVELSRVYVMNYSATESDYEKYLPVANDIIKSFKELE